VIAQHLPILQVVLPLLAAPICMFIRHPRVVWMWAFVTAWLCLPMSVGLLLKVLEQGTIVYNLGGWAAPWGIEYRIDILNSFVLIIVSMIGAIVLPFARRSVEREIPQKRIYLFYTMLLLCLAGLLGMTITGDAFNLFVFLEISSLSTYVLISFGKDRRALTAAYRYLIVGTIGATFYIIGVGLLYMATGSLNIADLAVLIPNIGGNRTVQSGMAFLIIGLALKAALFPMHMWLPNAYTYAPSVVSIFLSATATKVAVYAFIRVVFSIFGDVNILEILPVRNMLMVLAIAAMVIGSAAALYQTDVRRLFAYSSIAQIGYIILGISFDSVTGVTAGVVHLFNHALMKGGLFMVLGLLAYQIGSTKIQDIAGLGERMPLTMAALVIGGLGLIGMPLTAGFISKWYLIQAAIDIGLWPIAFIIVLSSILTVVYVWRIVEVIYFHRPVNPINDIDRAPISMVAPMWILIGATIFFGINTNATLEIAGAAAKALLAGGV